MYVENDSHKLNSPKFSEIGVRDQNVLKNGSFSLSKFDNLNIFSIQNLWSALQFTKLDSASKNKTNRHHPEVSMTKNKEVRIWLS